MDIKPVMLLLAALFFSAAAAAQVHRIPRSVGDAGATNSCTPYVIVQRDGRDGLPGRDGIAGRDGLPGSPGVVGEKGEQGPPGLQGLKGQQGLHGLTGPRGPRGFAGSRGQKGDRGQQGIVGQTGRQGPMGRTGNKGQKGERGVNGLRGLPSPTAGGVVYTRWGKTTCPSTSGTQRLYAGRAAGSWYNHRGGGANYLCLPEQPQYSTYTAGVQSGRAYLYGAEYQTAGYANSPLRSFNDHNVPCAVCYTSTRGTAVMIPAQYTCPSSWTREYYGYLMAEQYSHHRSTFECVDRYPQSVPGSIANTNGALFYHVEVQCNYGIPCPPYDTQKEIMCVVCTK